MHTDGARCATLGADRWITGRLLPLVARIWALRTREVGAVVAHGLLLFFIYGPTCVAEPRGVSTLRASVSVVNAQRVVVGLVCRNVIFTQAPATSMRCTPSWMTTCRLV